MDNNKILIHLSLPTLEMEYDIFIPINKRIGTIKQLIEKNLSETINYEIVENSNLYNAETGIIYDATYLEKDTDLKNSTKVILL